MTDKTDDPNVKPALPNKPAAPGTVDITNLVEDGRKCFVELGMTFVAEGVSKVPWLSWLNLPVIKQAFKATLKYFLNMLSTWCVLQAFIANTIMRKRGQAKDWTNALDALKSLPKTASKEEYANAENKKMEAFRNFVMFVN